MHYIAAYIEPHHKNNILSQHTIIMSVFYTA